MSADACQATVYVCQGGSDPAWRVPYDRYVEHCRARRPGHRIELAFCEAMAPGPGEVIDELAIDLCDRIRIITLDLAPGSQGELSLGRTLQAASQRWPELVFEKLSASLDSPDAPARPCPTAATREATKDPANGTVGDAVGDAASNALDSVVDCAVVNAACLADRD